MRKRSHKGTGVLAAALFLIGGCGHLAGSHQAGPTSKTHHQTAEAHPKLNGYAVTYKDDPEPNFVCALSLSEINSWHNMNFKSIRKDARYDAPCKDPANWEE
jgi:hypothetical protein